MNGQPNAYRYPTTPPDRPSRPVPARERCERCPDRARVWFHRDGEVGPRQYCHDHARRLFHAVYGHDGLHAALRFGSTFALPARPSQA